MSGWHWSYDFEVVQWDVYVFPLWLSIPLTLATVLSGVAFVWLVGRPVKRRSPAPRDMARPKQSENSPRD